MLVLSNINNIIKLGNIKSNIISKEEILFYELTILKNNEHYLLLRSNTINENYIESYGYEEVINESLTNDITKNLYLLIYYQNNGILQIEEIKINCKKILTNDKLINPKNNSISSEKELSISYYDNYQEKITYQQKLLEEGFKNIDNPLHECQKCLTKKVSDNEYISVNSFTNYLYYNYKNDIYEIRALYDIDKKQNEIIFHTKKNNNWNYLIYDINTKTISGTETSEFLKEKIEESLQ
ncbi:MAG: hypothetical protein ACI4XM_00585 [Candidatus Coprovivens sp.]